MEVVAGVDLGGTAINYTLVNREEKFLIEGLCEHPALSKQGPEVCLQQIADGLKIATDLAGIALGRPGGHRPRYSWAGERRGPAQRTRFDELCASPVGGI